MSTCASTPRRARAAGFSLLEVMVALIVLSVGLLGIARMQSLALSSTAVASKRGVAAIEAASIAASMHVNRGYWTNGDPAGSTLKIVGTTFTAVTGFAGLTGAGNPACNTPATPCTPTQIAAHDLQQWASIVTAANGPLPNATTTISCGAVTPVSCNILIQWAEGAVALNTSQVNAEVASEAAATTDLSTAAGFENPSYQLYVEP